MPTAIDPFDGMREAATQPSTPLRKLETFKKLCSLIEIRTDSNYKQSEYRTGKDTSIRQLLDMLEEMFDAEVK